MFPKINPQLVAHRGYSSQYPENTLLAIEQAFNAGACFVECDVQLTRDGVPVLLHDVKLQRTTSNSGNVNDLKLQQLSEVRAGFGDRFGEAFIKEPLPTLQQLVDLMRRWSNRQVFVEVKRATINRFGKEIVLENVANVINQISSQAILISFDSEFIKYAQASTSFQCGWVVDEWDSANLDIAKQLQPDYLFVDVECIPAKVSSLPDTSWSWVLYEIDDVQLANLWIQRGAQFIETNDIGGLLATTEFQNCRCHG